MLQYAIKLEPDDNGTLLVICRALPDVVTFGEDRDDAMRRAVDAIEEATAARIAGGEDVSMPTRVPVRRLKASPTGNDVEMASLSTCPSTEKGCPTNHVKRLKT